MKYLDNLDDLVSELKKATEYEEFIIVNDVKPNQNGIKGCNHKVYLNSIVPVDECMSSVCIYCGKLGCACNIPKDQSKEDVFSKLKTNITVNGIDYPKGQYIGDAVYDVLYKD